MKESKSDLPDMKYAEHEYTEEDLQRACSSFYARYVKRPLDFCLALMLLAIIWPFMLVAGMAVALETGFPVLYRPLRGGWQGQPFRIFKFRTMVHGADRLGGGTTALNDKRITKVGNVLRKTKLDETIQLFNILNGTMSFVGPRPELLEYTQRYTGLEKYILKVRPGITDFSSLKFISLDEIVGATDADAAYEQKVLPAKNRLRLRYVAEQSFLTDVRLVLCTIGGVFRKSFRFALRG